MKNYNTPGESDHASHPVHCVRHCSGRGFHGLVAAAGPRRPCHTATRALRHSGASGEQGVPPGSRRRHPELHLPAVPKPDHSCRAVSRHLRLCLATLHAAGHPVRGQ